MTLNDFGRFLNTKSVGRIEAPVNEQLTERVFTALKHIAKTTIGITWMITNPDEVVNYEIMRKIDANTWIRFPNKPTIDTGENIDIDNGLIDALALYVMAGLEMQRSKVLMAMYYEEIDRNNQRLVETYLEEATNDAPRYYAFP